MRKSLIFALSAIMTMASCTKSEQIGSQEASPIGFNSFVNNVTKSGSDSSFEDGAKFFVDAFYTKNETFANATLQQFMKNQTVTNSTSSDGVATWSYSPLKYWPNNSGELISFFAITDATSTSTFSFDTNSTPSKDAVAFTVADASTDIMVATIINQSKVDQSLLFSFKHIMSQVNFLAALDKALVEDDVNGDLTEVNITSLSVDYGNFNQSGTFTFNSNVTTGSPSGNWSAVDSDNKATKLFNESNSSAGINKALKAKDVSYTTIGEPIMVMPIQGNDFTVTVNYDVATVDADNDFNCSKISNTCTFKIKPVAQNTKYTYKINIKMSSVEVSGEVSSWDSGVTEEIYDVDTTTGVVTGPQSN